MRLVLESPTDGAEPLPPEPTGWTDPLTGLDGPALWERELAKEEARNRRYRRTATVAVAEIRGFPEVAAEYGDDAALDAFREACRVVGAETRTSDYAARIAATRLAFLLLEADETAAVHFVDRVALAFERAIGPGRQLTIAFGWASPRPSESLQHAQAAAFERLKTAATASAPQRVALPPVDDRHRDPWWDLDGVAAAAARHRTRIRARVAFGLAAIADVMTAAAWALHVAGVMRLPILH